MIDALLYAVRDGIRAAGFNYGKAECEIMEDGKPPPRAGNMFVAVHGGKSSPGPSNERNLHKLFDFSVTLTMRVTVPIDRVGDQQIARNIALVPLAQRQGFDAKLEQLQAFLHMNWQITVLQGQTPNSANDNLAVWTSGTVYGFVRPARLYSYEVPHLAGDDWMDAEPNSDMFAIKSIKSETVFRGAERFQPQTASVGVFV